MSANEADLARGRGLVAITLILTAVRLAFAAFIPLTEDEAYYRLWAEHLQAGYLDHPPMIAWWIWLGERIAGDTPLGVRLLPVLATGLSTWLIGDTARRLEASEAVAMRAGLWWNATFTIALGGLVATPDAPACFFWSVALWALARERQSGAGAWWLAAGFAAGLACLSKYSGFFLAPGVLLWLIVTPGGLGQLKRPWPWLATVAALIAFAPNLAWNAAHGWMTFGKQFGRIGAHALHPERLPEFLATQALLLNPLIAVLAGIGLTQAWRLRRDPRLGGLLLPLALATPFVLYLGVHSLHDRVQGHWPVPTFGAFAIAAAYAGETRMIWARRVVPALGLGLSALVLAYAALPQAFLPPTADPTLAVRDWRPFARQLDELRRQQGAAWIGVESYGVASQLRAQGRIQAPVIQIIERDRWFHWQEGLAPAIAGHPGLVVDLARRLKPEELQACFTEVQPLGLLDRTADHRFKRRYAAYRVAGPKRDLITQGCNLKADEQP